ncbi:MAG TPA: PIN domain-containing protein [Thermodesulfovibrionia bacterium]|nr:PIN domain-containing protein [Thermodesulfovibrionia bacterium]
MSRHIETPINKSTNSSTSLIFSFGIAEVDEKVIDLSLTADFKDFEDAVQYYSAIKVKADCIITRNKDDYVNDKIPVLTPEEFLALFEN